MVSVEKTITKKPKPISGGSIDGTQRINRFIFGETKVPSTNIKIPNMVIGAGVLLAGVTLINFATGGRIFDSIGLGGFTDKSKGYVVDPSKVPSGIASKIEFQVSPTDIQPDGILTIQGTFFDSNGQPVKVAKAYYRVVEQGSQGSEVVKTFGVIGDNVFNFIKQIKLGSSYSLDARYRVDISDNPSFN